MAGKLTDFWGGNKTNHGFSGQVKTDQGGKKSGTPGRAGKDGAPAWKNKWIQKKAAAKANKGNLKAQMDELEELIETKGPRVISERLYDFVNVPKFPQYKILIPKELDRGVRPKNNSIVGNPDFKSSSHREIPHTANTNNPFASDGSEDRGGSKERVGMTSSRIQGETGNEFEPGENPDAQKKKLSLKGMNEKMKEITREQESKFKQSQAMQQSSMGTSKSAYNQLDATSKGGASGQQTDNQSKNSLLIPLSPLDHTAAKRGVSMIGYEGNSGNFLGVPKHDFLTKLVNKNKRLSFEEDYSKIVRSYKEGTKKLDPITLDSERKQKSFPFESNGITFHFPFEPYKQQTTFISNLVEALNKSSNGLLECPPGTGKTLAYLIGSLGWLQHQQAKNENLNTKIILAVKNYDKIAAAIKQLNISCYVPRVATLASRDKLCSNHENVRYMGWDKNCQCMAMLNESVCRYYHGFLNQRTRLKELQNQGYTFDIEDFKSLAAESTSCAYYNSRANIQDSHLIILPYYYLTKRELREEINEYIANSVVIIDDAHSSLNSAEEGVSSRFTEQEGFYLQKELTYFKTFLKRLQQASSRDDKRTGEVIKLLDIIEPPVRGFKNFMKKRYPKPEPSKDDIYNGLDLFEVVEEMLKPGAVDMMISKSGGSDANREQIIKELFKQSDAVNQLLEYVHLEKGSATRFAYLYKWAILLKRMWELLTDFTSVSKQRGPNEAWMYQKLSHYLVVFDDRMRPVPNQPNPAINLRPMSPHLCFQQINELNPRSIIMTSGWLSPTDKFCAMTQLYYETTVSIELLIKVPSQFYLGLLGKFQEDVAANVDYQSRNNEVVVEKLGQALIQVFELAPRSVIVYFTSHTLMNAYIERWKRRGIYDRMEKYKKITVEPAYNIKNKAIIANFKAHSQHGVGGALFAIPTGKLNEFGDLNQDLTRCIVMVGVPFPHKQDAVVNARKLYYEKFCHSLPELPQPNGSSKKRMNGNEWCNMYTARATSEALMPLIKDRYHYGAAILLDERYSWPYNQSGIANWMKPVLSHCNSTPELMEQLSTFFADTKVVQQTLKKEIEQHAKIQADAEAHIRPYGGGRKAINKERQKRLLEQQENGEYPGSDRAIKDRSKHSQSGVHGIPSSGPFNEEYSYDGDFGPEYGEDDYKGDEPAPGEYKPYGEERQSEHTGGDGGIVRRRTGWESQTAPDSKHKSSRMVDEPRDKYRESNPRERRDNGDRDHRSSHHDSRRHEHRSKEKRTPLGYKGQDLGKLKHGKFSKLRKPADDDSDDSEVIAKPKPSTKVLEVISDKPPITGPKSSGTKKVLDVEELSDGAVLMAEISSDKGLPEDIERIKKTKEYQAYATKPSESLEKISKPRLSKEAGTAKHQLTGSSRERSRNQSKNVSQEKHSSDDSEGLLKKASSYMKSLEQRHPEKGGEKEPSCHGCKSAKTSRGNTSFFELTCKHLLCMGCAKSSEDRQRNTTVCPRCATTMKTIQLKLI